jgi:hypothetical protein
MQPRHGPEIRDEAGPVAGFLMPARADIRDILEGVRTKVTITDPKQSARLGCAHWLESPSAAAPPKLMPPRDYSRPRPAQLLLVLLVTGRPYFVHRPFMGSDQLTLKVRLGHDDSPLGS